MKINFPCNLRLFSFLLVSLVLSSGYCRIAERNPYAKKKDEKVIVKREVEGHNELIRDSLAQRIAALRKFQRKRDIDSIEFPESPINEYGEKRSLPSFSVMDHKDIAEDNEQIKRKKGKHDNLQIYELVEMAVQVTTPPPKSIQSKSEIDLLGENIIPDTNPEFIIFPDSNLKPKKYKQKVDFDNFVQKTNLEPISNQGVDPKLKYAGKDDPERKPFIKVNLEPKFDQEKNPESKFFQDTHSLNQDTVLGKYFKHDLISKSNQENKFNPEDHHSDNHSSVQHTNLTSTSEQDEENKTQYTEKNIETLKFENQLSDLGKAMVRYSEEDYHFYKDKIEKEIPSFKLTKNSSQNLSSSEYEQRIKDVQIAKDYAALFSASFFGQPITQTEDGDDDGPTLFTIANSNVGRAWDTIPYREKFQWSKTDAPCFTFKINVPDERTGHGVLPICIFRQHLEYTEESLLIIHQEEKHFDVFEQRERKVSGHVKNNPGSAVYGRFVETYFYGEISLRDQETGEQTVYVVEEIKLLSRLLRHSHKLVNNLLIVMQSTNSNPSVIKYNAVVTKGVSILSFMSNPNPDPDEVFFRSFVILSTSQNSYITAGEPLAKLDEHGRLIFATRGNIVTIDTDVSVKLKTRTKEYTFRPRGKTMVSKGMNAEALRQLEGVVVITAITKSMTYSCVLPTPSFTQTRKGGFLCKVCLAADNSFRQKYLMKLGLNGTVSYFLGQTIDKVSWIFRSVDWDGDTKSDNVGLDYDLQYFHWDYPNDDGNEQVSEEGLEILFKSLANVDFSDCCLGIAFTMKKFPPSIYAKSSPSKPMTPGGACAIQNDGISNNAILISANNKKGNFSVLTENQLIYLTAHEIAKAFGAKSDTSGQAGCDSFIDSNGMTRHYLLWPDVMRNITTEEKSFSPCSRKSIFTALSSCISSCFDVDHHPFCGNGIQEQGEECDCGHEYDCSHQYCCYGRTGKFPCRKTGGPCQTNSTAAILNLFSSSHPPVFILITVIISTLNGLWILY